MIDISRRSFLGGTAAAAGLLATGPSVSVAAGNAPANGPEYGPAPHIAKLNANENPYGPSPAAMQAAFEAVRQGGAYYVRDTVQRLKAMIAERHGIGPDQVALANGSSAVLTFIATAASQRGNILTPDLFWDSTVRRGTRQSGEIVRLPKSESLAIDLEAMERAINEEIALVHVTNPNNPTSLLLDGEVLRGFVRRAAKKTTVLVDEAYNELTDKPEYYSMVDLVREGHNLIVARTFSKIYGMAGMRVGYTIASPENTALIESYSMGDYTLNQAGMAAAVASYNDQGFLEMSRAKIFEGREMIQAGLKANGLSALPSATNFLFVDLGDFNANDFQAKMAARNVMVRGVYRDYHNFSRVSMGRLEHVQMYVDALPAVLEEMKA
ncbi:MAG: aminotransferase class I/II-fold pyridoxal phosphate-dependent enzyme [Gammaproteobacteria bacterium]|jgi:histidinol-phosphate aminotransferase|nr:MAG: aminotransferase class I/II-fold pyridoxal phosphate-dependent enzyme [Gammaproteobacteria bacterium]